MTARTVDPRMKNAPQACYEMVSPALAERWLGRNELNRNMRRRAVTGYARDMAANRWRITGEAIQFAADGRLLDGQNRLAAVIESGATVPFLIVRGLEAEAQKVLDSGMKRTAADAIRLNGRDGSGTAVAAVTRGILVLRDRIYPTQTEIVEFAEGHWDEVSAAAAVGAATTRKIGGGNAFIGTAFYHLAKVDTANASVFFEKLAFGDGLDRTSPILVLRNAILADRLAQHHHRYAIEANVAMIFKAWNAWRVNKNISILRFGSTETFPVPK
jgi:hypothetical protein